MTPGFSTAVMRAPCRRMVDGIRAEAGDEVDFDQAVVQHDACAAALENLGLAVTVLPADEAFPDSVFVEDVAICTPPVAIVTNPGAMSRNGEKRDWAAILARWFEQVATIEPPGTLDGGDVMLAGRQVFAGLSARTNREGADQLFSILEPQGFAGTAIPLSTLLHLKSGVAWLDHETLLVAGELVGRPEFSGFRTIEVPPGEAAAANSLWINGTVLVPAGYPQTRDRIAGLGYAMGELDISEFAKLDGGLSCLSLRF